MRKAPLLLVGLLVGGIIMHAGDGRLCEAGEVMRASSLPRSLDGFYPPVAAQPVYLFRMLDLETSFSGIVVDLMEDDLQGARGSFADFRRHYGETAAMIPEWKGAFPTEPVEKLGAALAAGDRQAAMKAFSRVGAACHRCHSATMVPVQQRYRWGKMGALTLKDPLSGEATGYSRFKAFLAANLAGITVDLRQGQAENAKRQFQGFQARFRALAETCRGCHEQESRYYVDSDVQGSVEKIGAAFAGRDVNLDEVAGLVRKIGRESCSKCHLVHVPAAHEGRTAR